MQGTYWRFSQRSSYLCARKMYNGLAYNLSLTTPKYAEVTKPSGGYTSLGGAVNIPSTVYYNGTSYAVRTIGKQAFQSCKAITSVTTGSGAKRGDVNNDGQVTIADVVAVLNLMAGQ